MLTVSSIRVLHVGGDEERNLDHYLGTRGFDDSQQASRLHTVEAILAENLTNNKTVAKLLQVMGKAFRPKVGGVVLRLGNGIESLRRRLDNDVDFHIQPNEGVGDHTHTLTVWSAGGYSGARAWWGSVELTITEDDDGVLTFATSGPGTFLLSSSKRRDLGQGNAGAYTIFEGVRIAREIMDAWKAYHNREGLRRAVGFRPFAMDSEAPTAQEFLNAVETEWQEAR